MRVTISPHREPFADLTAPKVEADGTRDLSRTEEDIMVQIRRSPRQSLLLRAWRPRQRRGVRYVANLPQGPKPVPRTGTKMTRKQLKSARALAPAVMRLRTMPGAQFYIGGARYTADARGHHHRRCRNRY